MRGLHAREVLDLYERGAGRSLLERALLLLERALPDEDPARRAALPIGERDRRLAELRLRTLGRLAAARMPCERCGALLEAELDLQAIVASPGREDPFAVETFRHDGREVAFRPPGTADLAAALTAAEPAQDLAVRCLVPRAGDALPPALEPDFLDALDAACADADPLREIRIAVACASCGHASEVELDVVAFFWSELEAQAARLFGEVHRLALAYGWTEAEILALGPARRQAYLGMLG